MVTLVSLSSSEEEKFFFAPQITTSQPVGTRSGKQHLRQYDHTPDITQQPTSSKNAAPIQVLAPASPLDKEKQNEVWFDKTLKKKPSQGLNSPFRFDILAQLANISACITLHKILCLSKETREALRDALADLESFLT